MAADEWPIVLPSPIHDPSPQLRMLQLAIPCQKQSLKLPNIDSIEWQQRALMPTIEYYLFSSM